MRLARVANGLSCIHRDDSSYPTVFQQKTYSRNSAMLKYCQRYVKQEITFKAHEHKQTVESDELTAPIS